MLEIVDRWLQWMISNNLNDVPLPVHFAMACPQPSSFADDGYESWLLVPSIVAKQNLNELEEEIGCRLPVAYRRFLQHKHFYNLYVGGAEFFAHPIDEWQRVLRDEMRTNRPDEFRQTGLVPFASWGGAGDELCFELLDELLPDAPVVLWNHEDGSVELFAASFADLLIELDSTPSHYKSIA